jgi:hypothetical protein
MPSPRPSLTAALPYVAVLVLMLAAPRAQAAFSGHYKIVARHSGKVLNVDGASAANGARIVQWPFGGAATNDEWELLDIGGGFHRIVARHSGKDLNVQGASVADGAQIIQWPYGGAATNDEWRVEDLGDGFHRIVSRHSGKVLEVEGASTADGALVKQRSWSGASHQQFQIVSVTSALPAFCASYPRPMPAGGWESAAVHYDAGGRLVYATEGGGNRIPDFSYAGYENGVGVIPAVAEAARVTPGPGDDTARIQAAIDSVGQRPLGVNGYRGAVVLARGRYEIGGVVLVNRDGVVLRGSGQSGDPAQGTILRATGTSTATRVVLGTGASTGWDDEVAGTRTNITTTFVAAGARAFDVANAGPLAVGDTVVVVHPNTQAWYDAIDGGGVISDPPWAPGTLGDHKYKRRIAAKSGNRLTLDGPLFNHLDRSLTQPYVFKLRPGTAVSHVGIENLRVDSDFVSSDDEAHARSSIQVVGVEDAWIRDVTTLHFVYGGIHVSGDAVRVTVQRCTALDPVAQRTGGRMYSMVAEGHAQLVLFTGCRTRNGRHPYVTQVNGAAGIVFHRSVEEGNNTSNTAVSEGHRRWSQGLLYDHIQHVGNGNVHLGCRGDTATSHGWGAVHSVIWNPQFGTGRAWIEKPPTAQNWAIGAGPFSVLTNYCPDAQPGHIEQRSGVLRQESLYEAQLCDRLR